MNFTAKNQASFCESLTAYTEVIYYRFMVKKITVLFLLLSIAVAAVVSFISPAKVSAEALDCKVSHYRTLGHRLWFHNQAMVDRPDFDWDWQE